MKDHYRTLGVGRNASLNDIKAAFKRLALQYHPDRNPGDSVAEERFKEINEAYHILGNRESRNRYDLWFNYQNYQPQAQPYSFYRSNPYRRYRRPARPGGSTYRYDRAYFQNQALAILIVVFIAIVYLSASYVYKYIEKQKREEVWLANQKVLSAAHIKFNTGDFYGAMQMIEDLASEHPTEFYIDKERDEMIEEIYKQARRQFILQDYENAIYNLLIVKEFQHPQKLETLEYLARSYLAVEEFQKSAAIYEYIYLRDRYNLELVVRLAMLYHYDVKDLNRSLEFYDKAKRLFKERQRQLYGKAFELLMDPIHTPDLYYKLFYHRAKANMEAKDFETAVTDCNWASFLRPDETEPYLMRAMSYIQIKEPEKACTDYQIALRKGHEPASIENFCN